MILIFDDKPIYRSEIDYECCAGFVKSSDSSDGIQCQPVSRLKSLLEAAEEMGASKFVRLVKTVPDLVDELTHPHSALTLFAPLDEAMDSLPENARLALDVDLRSVILNHVVAGRVRTSTLSSISRYDESQLLDTLLAEQPIRLSKYSNAVFAINCVPIGRRDIETSNGVLHLIDGLVVPSRAWPLPTLPMSLMEDKRFSQFVELLIASDVIDELGRFPQSDLCAKYTLLVPTNDAIQRALVAHPYVRNDPDSRNGLFTILV